RLAEITGDASLATSALGRSAARDRLLGRAPRFRPWHPRWLDARSLRSTILTIAPRTALLVVADIPARVREWLEEAAASAGAASVTFLHPCDPAATGASVATDRRTFGSCLVLWPEPDAEG